MLIADAKIVTSQAVLDDGWLEVAGTQISRVGDGTPPGEADVSLGGAWAVPGFVDIHSHGGGGATVVGADPDAIRTFTETHRRHGTTTIVASLVSAQLDPLERDVRALAGFAEDGLIAGVHLEGPWIAPGRKGAHDPAALSAPEPAAVARLLAAGRGTVRMVTIAPELDHGIDAVRLIVEHGAIAAVGHTDAAYDKVRAAIDAGATVGTHLFNAMAPIQHRAPGPIIALLEDERVSVELICDGVHLHQAIAAHAYATAGADRVVLVTDAMAAAGGSDGDYLLGELAVRVQDGVARLVHGGAIAGSTLTMSSAFRFAVERAGFPMVAAVRASSTNPARLLGLADQVGDLADGLAADLVVLDESLALRGVLARGAWVVRPQI